MLFWSRFPSPNHKKMGRYGWCKKGKSKLSLFLCFWHFTLLLFKCRKAVRRGQSCFAAFCCCHSFWGHSGIGETTSKKISDLYIFCVIVFRKLHNRLDNYTETLFWESVVYRSIQSGHRRWVCSMFLQKEDSNSFEKKPV